MKGLMPKSMPEDSQETVGWRRWAGWETKHDRSGFLFVQDHPAGDVVASQQPEVVGSSKLSVVWLASYWYLKDAKLNTYSLPHLFRHNPNTTSSQNDFGLCRDIGGI